MVELVLNHTCKGAVDLDLALHKVSIQIADAYALRSHNLLPDVGDRETSFLELDFLLALPGDIRVDEDHRLLGQTHGVDLGIQHRPDVGHENALPATYLWCRQAHPPRAVHRLDPLRTERPGPTTGGRGR